MGGIQVGPVKEPGKDLPLAPGKNLASYIDKEGHFDLLGFFSDHRKKFPLLFVLAQRHASIVSNEAGAKRVFLQANIVAQPTRANIGVKTYERLVKRKVNNKILCIPVQNIRKEYIKRKKDGSWCMKRKADDMAAVALEEELEAALN